MLSLENSLQLHPETPFPHTPCRSTSVVLCRCWPGRAVHAMLSQTGKS